VELNPAYRPCQETQKPAGTATSLPNLALTLPLVFCMDDYIKLNNDLGIKLDDFTSVTIDMMQESEFCAEVGLSPETIVDEFGSVLSRYEVPMGLMTKKRCFVVVIMTLKLNIVFRPLTAFSH